MIYLTADSHFFHVNILQYCHRPYTDVYQMNDDLINNWNKVVSPSDYVYHLGDLCFTLEQLKLIIPRLNGKIKLVPGNHDHWVNDYKNEFRDKLSILPKIYEFRYDKIPITMCHYPLRTWNQSHFGAMHVFGHIHSEDNKIIYGRSLDVGVDAFNYTPVALEEVISILSQIKNTPYPVYDWKY